MQGVEILTSAQVATEFAYNWTAAWITLVAVFGLCLIFSIVSFFINGCDWEFILLGSAAGVILGLFFGILSGGIFTTPDTYETQYKVIISDEVSMTEFYERYEVIGQDGKIFTVKEKTNDMCTK